MPFFDLAVRIVLSEKDCELEGLPFTSPPPSYYIPCLLVAAKNYEDAANKKYECYRRAYPFSEVSIESITPEQRETHFRQHKNRGR